MQVIQEENQIVDMNRKEELQISKSKSNTTPVKRSILKTENAKYTLENIQLAMIRNSVILSSQKYQKKKEEEENKSGFTLGRLKGKQETSLSKSEPGKEVKIGQLGNVSMLESINAVIAQKAFATEEVNINGSDDPNLKNMENVDNEIEPIIIETKKTVNWIDNQSNAAGESAKNLVTGVLEYEKYHVKSKPDGCCTQLCRYLYEQMCLSSGQIRERRQRRKH